MLRLVIGNKNYSSWSLRAWLALRQVGIDFEEIQIPLGQPDSLELKLRHSPAGKVPVLIDGDTRVWESLAILDHLAERFPDAALWPADGDARALARSVSAEMHAGFDPLRSHMFMNCRSRFPGKGREPGVMEDVERIREIWRDCRARHGRGGELLFGDFTIPDAMFAPVVLRFETYAVELDATCRAYADAILRLPAMAEWLEAAEREPWTIPQYEY